jgi:hypothetical protein
LVLSIEHLLAGRVLLLRGVGYLRFHKGRLQRAVLEVDPDTIGPKGSPGGMTASELRWINAETLPMDAGLRGMAGQPVPTRRRVVVETPFRGGHDPSQNAAYLRAAMQDCINRGEAPFAPYRMYAEALDDGVPEERELGIELGFEWGLMAHATVVYTDRGMSAGMRFGVRAAERSGRLVERRTLPGWSNGA